MYITAMTHRDKLFDLTLRWLNDDFRPEDGKTITRIFVYESAISAVLVDQVIGWLVHLFQRPLVRERIRQKHALRWRLIDHLPRQTPRIGHLIQDFQQNPEYFFPRLPIDALFITTEDSNLAAIGRVKRLSRVAEKVSFRLVDALFQEIQIQARRFATQRAAATGVHLEDLLSSEKEMQNDFVAAETYVARRFRNHNVSIPRQALTINDLMGFKIIGDQALIEEIPDIIDHWPGFTLLETERHTGDYNAVNLLVEVMLPDAEELVAQVKGFDWSVAQRRGLDRQETEDGFLDYLKQGSDSVRMEIILTTYDELMESEFGRSIHELRILRLRQRQPYSGPIAQNAAYLIEYMLTLAASPAVDVFELPIKMYGRYLPETIDSAKGVLFGQDMDGGLLDAFCLKKA